MGIEPPFFAMNFIKPCRAASTSVPIVFVFQEPTGFPRAFSPKDRRRVCNFSLGTNSVVRSYNDKLNRPR